MMHGVWKIYVNYEKEEKWLNSMAQRGMHMVDYTFCRYLFEEGTPGEYIYRIELFKHMPSHPESASYLKFMEESGVEVVSTYMRWVYFRKKASEGSFEIYTDRQGKIKHAKRVIGLVSALFILNFAVALDNLFIGLTSDRGIYFNAYLSVLNFTVAAVLLTIIIAQCRIIRRQKKDTGIRE
ncbi:MAG: DUF2812 domain-containing protein [Eubacteriales bacterium]